MSYADDMWGAASEDHESLARRAALARADAELEEFMPFLLASRSPQEFGYRLELAHDPLARIAASAGVGEDELAATARRRYELMTEALSDGQDPLEAVVDASHASGGPEKPDEHDTGPDYSHAYSEVPMAANQGPDPQVTQVRPPEVGPVTEATGSLRKQADGMTAPYTPPLPPDTGIGAGSTDIGTPGAATNDMTPSLPTGGPAGRNAPDMPVTSPTGSADPVRRKVLAVTAAIRATNPELPAAEAERVARKVVGRYFTADLDSSVVADDPGGGSDSGGGSGSGGGFGKVIQHGLEWQGLKGLMPGAGGAAGGAGLVGDAAELAAL